MCYLHPITRNSLCCQFSDSGNLEILIVLSCFSFYWLQHEGLLVTEDQGHLQWGGRNVKESHT